MSAGMEGTDSMFSVRELPWHGNGLVLEAPPKNIDEALTLAGLDWDVIQIPVSYEWNGKMVEDPSIRLNVREDTGKVLGRVTKDYVVFQNRDAFSFLANVFGSDMLFETAGSLHGGRRVYVTTRMPEYVEVGGDTVGIYGFISNSHAGWEKGKVKPTAIRVVCQNTETAALLDGRPTYGFTHLASPQQKVMQAREALGVTVDFSKQFKEFGDKLALVPFTEKQLKNVLAKLYPIEPAWTDRKAQNAQGHRDSISYLFREGKTSNEYANAPGTAWTALQSIVEYADWGMPKSDDDEPDANHQIVRAIDDPSSLKKKATRLIADRADLVLA